MEAFIALTVAGLVAGLWIVVLADRARSAPCPWCARRIPRRAIRCPHCSGRIYPAGEGGAAGWKACRYCLEPIDLRASRCPCCAADLARPAAG